MAASAKEKAYNLKDSYVAGLIEGGATAPAPSMPTQDMGEQASMKIDLNRGVTSVKNDGDPRLTMAGPRGSFTMIPHDSAQYVHQIMSDGKVSPELSKEFLAKPLYKKGYGATDQSRMNNSDRMRDAEIYHGIKNKGLY